jgi:DNA polymerase III delta subunit
VTDSTKENDRALVERLDELGVSIEPDAVEELAEAYPALVEWMRIAQELAEP